MGFDIVRDKVLLAIIVGVDEGVSVDVIVGSYLWTVEARLFPCNIRVGAFCKVSFSPDPLKEAIEHVTMLDFQPFFTKFDNGQLMVFTRCFKPPDHKKGSQKRVYSFYLKWAGDPLMLSRNLEPNVSYEAYFSPAMVPRETPAWDLAHIVKRSPIEHQVDIVRTPWKRMDRRIRENAISGSVAEENNKQQFASIFRRGDEKWKDRRCGFLVFSRIDGNDPETVIFSCHGGFVATEEPLLNAALGSFFSGSADFEKGKLVKVRGAPYVDKWFSYYAEKGEDGSKHMVARSVCQLRETSEDEFVLRTDFFGDVECMKREIDDALTKVFLSREDTTGHALVVWLRYEQPFKTWGLVKVDETEPIRALNCSTVAGCEFELERDLLGGLIMPTVAEDGEDSDEVEEHA